MHSPPKTTDTTPMTPLVLDREAVARITEWVETGQSIYGTNRIREDLRPIIALTSQAGGLDGWQDIASAPKDGSYILAVVAPDRGRHLEHHAGRVFVIRHEGVTQSGYDMGWAVYPGFGGASDHNFTLWHPVPAIRASNPSVGGGV